MFELGAAESTLSLLVSPYDYIYMKLARNFNSVTVKKKGYIVKELFEQLVYHITDNSTFVRMIALKKITNLSFFDP